MLDPRGELTLDVPPDFEHGVLVDVGPVLLDGTELARAELGYLPPGADQLTLANPGDRPARMMLLGGAPFTEPVLMWWNFVGRTHEEIAGFREEWQAGSERFGGVEGYRGQVQRLPAPPMPTVRLKPRLAPPGHGDPSAWGYHIDRFGHARRNYCAGVPCALVTNDDGIDSPGPSAPTSWARSVMRRRPVRPRAAAAPATRTARRASG